MHFFALATLLLLAPTTSAQSRFTSEERVRLDRGELVTRPTRWERGEALFVGGTAWQIVDAPVDAVWRAACDTSAYVHLLPAAVESRNVTGGGTERTVFLRHRVGPVEGSYHLNLRFFPGERLVQFQLDHSRANDIQEAWGFLSVRRHGGGQTLLVWGIVADLGRGLFTAIVRSRIHGWLLRVPETFRAHIEGPGRRRYLRARSR